MLVRIGLLSDVHYGSDTEFQKGSRAAHLLRDFCVRMGEFKPQFIVDLGGDRINNRDSEHDKKLLIKFRDGLAQLTPGVEFEYILGNHDIAHLTAEENTRLFDQHLSGLRYRAENGFVFLFVNSEQPIPPHLDFNVLKGGKRKGVFVFSHRPLLAVDVRDNRLFSPEVPPQHCLWGPKFVKQLAEKGGYYPICIHGHLHWNYCLVNTEVIQVCIPSLVDTWEVGRPSESFGEIIVDTHLNLNIRGLLPAHYCFELRG